MKSYIALLRGINVGGKNIVPMAALRECVSGIGLRGVKTYIQSGNLVFRSSDLGRSELAENIREAMASAFDVAPAVMILSAEELERAVRSTPFSSGEAEDNKVHLFFLDAIPGRESVDAAIALASESEECQLLGSVFYLAAPDGIARSKLAMRLEKVLGVSATARNLRSSQKILELARKNEG